MNGVVYPMLAIFGIVLTSILWERLTMRSDFDSDRRLPAIYLSGLIGAFLGAKIVYMLAEGWIHWPDYADNPGVVWRAWATGKTVTGALLGGYVSVELAKKWLKYSRPTGDLFAVLAPLGLGLGRVGCWVQGCCLGIEQNAQSWTILDAHGVPRWPSVQIELLFNFTLFAFALICWRRRLFEGQLLHVYLIAYGLFRFAHEFLRATPNILGSTSGYQIAALCILALGVLRYRQREQGRLLEHNQAMPGAYNG